MIKVARDAPEVETLPTFSSAARRNHQHHPRGGERLHLGLRTGGSCSPLIRARCTEEIHWIQRTFHSSPGDVTAAPRTVPPAGGGRDCSHRPPTSGLPLRGVFIFQGLLPLRDHLNISVSQHTAESKSQLENVCCCCCCCPDRVKEPPVNNSLPRRFVHQ